MQQWSIVGNNEVLFARQQRHVVCSHIDVCDATAEYGVLQYCTQRDNGVLCATMKCCEQQKEVCNRYHRVQSTTEYGVRQRSIAWYASIACHNT